MVQAMTPQTLKRWLVAQLRPPDDGRQFTRTDIARSFNSSGRKYSFYWHRKGNCLAVSVRSRLREKVRPVVEALAEELRQYRVCPLCGTSFPRGGKRRFCSPQHAARYRKRRWAKRRRLAKEEAHRAELATRAAALGEAAAKAERRRGPYRKAVTRSEESL